MSTPDAEISTISESITFSTGLLGRMNSWTEIKLEDGLVENEARAQIQSQVQSLIRDIRLPWMTAELTPQRVEAVIMDVLQHVCHYGRAFNR